jgi:predicted O-methyltransferase YrrM
VGLFSSRKGTQASGVGPAATAAEPVRVSAGAPHYTTDYVTAHTANWTDALRGIIGKPDALGLEIGAYEGRSTRWFVEHVLTGPRSRLVVIDPYPRPTFHANVADVAAQIDYLKEPSQVALRDRRWRQSSFDFAYIDGDHSARAVFEDSVLVWRLLKPGGILIWDDYRWKAEDNTDPLRNPGPAIDAFLAIHKGDYDVLLSAWQVILRRTSA